MTRPTFEEACARYVHRFTMDYVPTWARLPMPSGAYSAPQFRSDREWYANTVFPGEPDYMFGKRATHCYTTGQTWPMGQFLKAPYRRSLRDAVSLRHSSLTKSGA